MAQPAAAAPNIQQQFQNALDDRKTSKLPAYKHDKDDPLTARQLIEKIEDIASSNATWNEQRKIVELKLCLQGDAKHTWDSLIKILRDDPEEGQDLTKWDQYKRLFLNQFDPTSTETAISLPFYDLKQKSSETVTQFMHRVDRHFQQLWESHPNRDHKYTDERLATIGCTTAEEKRNFFAMLEESNIFCYRRFEGMSYTNGLLSEPIRTKIREGKKADSIKTAWMTAKEQELLLEKKQVEAINARAVAAIKEDEDTELEGESIQEADLPSVNVLAAYEPADEADWNWMNSMRAARNMPPRPKPQFFGRPNGNGRSHNNSNGNNGNYRSNGNGNRNGNRDMVCRYKPCGKKGHKQADCYMRKRDRAPCVDEQGRPWRNQPGMNAIEDTAALNSYRVM